MALTRGGGTRKGPVGLRRGFRCGLLLRRLLRRRMILVDDIAPLCGSDSHARLGLGLRHCVERRTLALERAQRLLFPLHEIPEVVIDWPHCFYALVPNLEDSGSLVRRSQLAAHVPVSALLRLELLGEHTATALHLTDSL